MLYLRKIGLQLSVEARVQNVSGTEVDEGCEDELPFVECQVRHRERVVEEDLTPVQEDIQIDRAGTELVRRILLQLLLYLFQIPQQQVLLQLPLARWALLQFPLLLQALPQLLLLTILQQIPLVERLLQIHLALIWEFRLQLQIPALLQ